MGLMLGHHWESGRRARALRSAGSRLYTSGRRTALRQAESTRKQLQVALLKEAREAPIRAGGARSAAPAG